jgi:hypothetical protein
MKVKDSKAAIEFLEEASRYFEKRPTHGEDKAYWSNVYNAENCLGIVKLIEAKDSQIRTLEKGVLDLSVVVNDQVKEIKKLRRNLNAKLSDHINGTPCAQIRWGQEREELEAKIEKLLAALEAAADGFEVNGLYTRANKIYKVLDKA